MCALQHQLKEDVPCHFPYERVLTFFKNSTIFFALVLGCLFLAVTSLYTVDQGERGVVLRFGKLESVVDSGLHLRVPFVDSVKIMSVRTQKRQLELNVYSKDVQGAKVLLSVNYALSPESVGDIYTVGGLDYENRLILPQLMAKPKDVFGKYNAVNIV